MPASLPPIDASLRELLTAAIAHLTVAATPPTLLEPLVRAQSRLNADAWTVLVAGLRSVGKSSFVCALWGDNELLPTAVRDCTQSNTLVRIPAAAETDRTLNLHWLPRDRALEFATRGLAYYRIDTLLDELLGPAKPRFDERPPADRLHGALATLKKLFHDRRDLAVLHEPVTEQIEQLDQFLTFLDSADYHPGRIEPAPWSERRDYLMGRRRDDGRTVDVGRLLTLTQVEVLRQTVGWTGAPPRLFDTPWVPKFHNARRAELAAAQAREVDLIVLLALPELLEPEEWLEKLLTEQPEIGRRTLVIFNQIDTVDTLSLFRRDGFAELFDKNAATLRRLNIPAENLRISCARLPFLKAAGTLETSAAAATDATAAALSDVGERQARLEKTLAEIRRAADRRSDATIAERLVEATDSSGGLQPIRDRLVQLRDREVLPARTRAALTALAAVEDRLSADLRARLTGIQLRLGPPGR